MTLAGSGDEEQLGTASAAFSKGLDKEDDFDLTDHLALASGTQDARPRPHTEVLDGNAYDERLDRPHGSTSASHLVAAVAVQGNKRTRDGQPAAAAAGPSSGQPGVQRQHRDRQAHVPDHVKNPHKYTCYTLDEPLVVGSGVGGDSVPTSSMEVEHREGPAAEQLGDASENPAIPGRVAYRARPKAAGDQEPEHMQTDAMEALEAANTAQAIVRTGLHTAPVIMGDAAEGGELGMQASAGEAIALPPGRRPARSARRSRQRLEAHDDSD